MRSTSSAVLIVAAAAAIVLYFLLKNSPASASASSYLNTAAAQLDPLASQSPAVGAALVSSDPANPLNFTNDQWTAFVSNPAGNAAPASPTLLSTIEKGLLTAAGGLGNALAGVL
jgi:hypothetical protein